MSQEIIQLYQEKAVFQGVVIYVFNICKLLIMLTVLNRNHKCLFTALDVLYNKKDHAEQKLYRAIVSRSHRLSFPTWPPAFPAG